MGTTSSYPDHNTINRFRGEKLENSLKDIFSQVVMLLVDEGYVSLKKAYIDGTKIEANASRYSFVWGRSIATSKKKLKYASINCSINLFSKALGD
jgi:transposase